MTEKERNFKIAVFFCKLVIDLVSVCDYSPGKSFRKFTGIFRMTGRLPVKENNRMCAAQRPVSVDPHIGLLTVIMDYQVRVVPQSFPFYILLYKKYGDLYSMMEKCIEKGFSSVKIGKHRKNELKKGFNNYKKMSIEKKKNFFKIYFNTKM